MCKALDFKTIAFEIIQNELKIEEVYGLKEGGIMFFFYA